jgi:hypothetical protein
MSDRTSIEDTVRAWLVASAVAGGVPHPDRAVVIADQDAARPPLPYLLVRVLVHDIPVGEDEDLVDDADPPTWRARGQRTGTVSVNAFGVGAEAWLERAVIMLRSPSVAAILLAGGLTVRPEGGLNNLSGLLDERTQVRFHRDFFVDYAKVGGDTDAEDAVELEQVVHEDTFHGSPGDRVVTVTEVLS